uniref:Uncharacterized protein n=1 Tax=Magallana gigas TaxID=29159 RepID=K1QIA8_MAGGI
MDSYMPKRVEPPSNRSQPIGHGVSRLTGSTRAVGRPALGGANRVLSKEQIRHFITSTVIPHHRSLTRAEPRVNEPYSRPEDTNSAHKRPEMINHSSSAVSRTNMEVSI